MSKTALLNQLVQEKRKLLEIKRKQLEAIDIKLKKDIIKEVGEYMELHIHQKKVS